VKLGTSLIFYGKIVLGVIDILYFLWYSNYVKIYNFYSIVHMRKFIKNKGDIR